MIPYSFILHIYMSRFLNGVGISLLLLVTVLTTSYMSRLGTSMFSSATYSSAPCTSITSPGDYNCDGTINSSDIDAFISDFKSNSVTLATFEPIRQAVFEVQPDSKIPTQSIPTSSPTERPTITMSPPSPTPNFENVTKTGIDVMVLTIDPIFSSTNKSVRETYGYIDPLEIFTLLKEKLKPYLPIRIAQQTTYTKFPPLKGFTPAQVQMHVEKCLKNISGDNPDCKNSWVIDYNELFTELKICEKVNSNQIDELWIGTYPYNGSGEDDMVGPNPFFINGHVVVNTICKKNAPILAADYAAPGTGPGQSALIGVALTMHSAGHRIESTMRYVSGQPKSGQPQNDWQHFSYAYSDYGRDNQNTPPFGCGNIHFPPNAEKDYEYDLNSRSTLSYCDEYKKYPLIPTPPTSKNISCSAWGCSQLGYMEWWYSSLPHTDGTSDGLLNNWYEYVFNPERAIFEASTRSGATTIQSPDSYIYAPLDHVEHYYGH